MSGEAQSGDVSAEQSQEVTQTEDQTTEGAEETSEGLDQAVSDAIEGGASEKQIEKMIKKYQLKVNGKVVERELDLSDENAVKRELQMAMAGRGAMQEAAELKKLYEQEIKRLKTNPWDVLKELDLDIDGLNESYLQDRINNLKKSPQQVEREKLEKELTDARSELERQKKQNDTARFAALQEKEAKKLNEEIDEALSSNTQLPKTKGVIAKIADTMLWAMENAKRIAEEFLKEGMLKSNHAKAAKTAEDLAFAEKYTLHAHLIDWKEAGHLLGEENILYLKPENEEWRLYWELYIRSSVFLDNPVLVKLFESESNSINIQVMMR